MLTIQQTEALKAYAEKRGADKIAYACCPMIDALNGEPDFDLAEAENGIWEAIEMHQSAPSFYGVIRAAKEAA